MRGVVVGALLLFALAGCATTAPRPLETVRVALPLDADSMAWFSQPGTGTISGQAFLRQAGGGTVTAAGETVYLSPASSYFRLWFQEKERAEFYDRIRKKYVSNLDDPQALAFLKKTKADLSGRFKFDHLPDGDYLIATRIVWLAGKSWQGGVVMTTVQVLGGKPVDVVVSDLGPSFP